MIEPHDDADKPVRTTSTTIGASNAANCTQADLTTHRLAGGHSRPRRRRHPTRALPYAYQGA